MIVKCIVNALCLLFVATGVQCLCNNGVEGVCGMRPNQCPPGSRCRYLIPNAPVGMCCLDRPDPRCPPPYMVGTCRRSMLSLAYSCLNNNDCDNNQVCCPEPCGGTCKDPIPYRELN